MNRRLALWTGLRFRSDQLGGRRATGRSPSVTRACRTRPAAKPPPGVQLSDAVLLHVGAGAEAGYDTNVFYQRTRHPARRPSIRTMPVRRAHQHQPNGRRSAAGLRRARQRCTIGATSRTTLKFDGYRNAWMPTAGLSLELGYRADRVRVGGHLRPHRGSAVPVRDSRRRSRATTTRRRSKGAGRRAAGGSWACSATSTWSISSRTTTTTRPR